ncbi:AAA family ATPase [Flavobacterium selenitireducens]|uniref:AAA family ATPase n=1 Tax=Flavobacterium selenitireducens TaxID=2722704 RepID=UPI00168B4E83|nr:ATP-binding protein [Flavobacterium selenitireducens]MBD3583059.1 AAA family ATPase [Flavobacterium selenitireducens]
MNLHDLLIHDKEIVRLDDVFLLSDKRMAIVQLIKEHRYGPELRKFGLPVSHKILLHGSSGCGKTMTAKAIANSLGKQLFVLNLSNVVNSRIGETSQNIKGVFEKAAREKAVLFLDEFDQIGKSRGNDDKDVGEMRRLVNTLIQLIDHLPEETLLLCATNHVAILDDALLRRFQVKIIYGLPSDKDLDHYYEALLERFPSHLRDIDRKYNVSYAEAKDHAFSIVKSRLIAQFESADQFVSP